VKTDIVERWKNRGSFKKVRKKTGVGKRRWKNW